MAFVSHYIDLVYFIAFSDFSYKKVSTEDSKGVTIVLKDIVFPAPVIQR